MTEELRAVKEFLQRAAFREARSLSDLPAYLASELEKEPLADIGAPYQVGCVVRGELLPLSRLLSGYIDDSAEEVLLHYESGGFAHTYSLRLYRKVGSGAELVAGSYVPSALVSGADILGLVNSQLRE